MKSFIEILKEVSEKDHPSSHPYMTATFYEGSLHYIEEAAKKYAEQAIDRTSEVAEGDLLFIDGNLEGEFHSLIEYAKFSHDDYEVGISRESILQVKKELK